MTMRLCSLRHACLALTTPPLIGMLVLGVVANRESGKSSNPANVIAAKSIGSPLPIGKGDAMAEWMPSGGGVYPPPRTFSGLIDGLRLSGAAKGSRPGVSYIAKWSGTLGGAPFDILVSAITNSSRSEPSLLAKGTFGAAPVKITIEPKANVPIPFAGTIGSETIKGVFQGTRKKGRFTIASATITVGKSRAA
jgi:hypothetical protein